MLDSHANSLAQWEVRISDLQVGLSVEQNQSQELANRVALKLEEIHLLESKLNDSQDIITKNKERLQQFENDLKTTRTESELLIAEMTSAKETSNRQTQLLESEISTLRSELACNKSM